MRSIDKDREWAYIEACPFDAELTPGECEALEDILCGGLMRKALGIAYRQVRHYGTQALRLPTDENQGQKLAELQGKAQGMTLLIQSLFDLTEKPDDVVTHS